jgi:hypothetical protein
VSSKSKFSKTNFGSLVHDVLDKVYTNGSYPASSDVNYLIDAYIEKHKDELGFDDDIEQIAALAEVSLVNYFKFYEKDFTEKKFYDVEKEFAVPLIGETLRGKIDGKYHTSDGTKWLMEHKTKGQINEDHLLKILNIDFQNMFYLLADYLETKTLARGVLYNVIRKSAIRRTKSETIKQYKTRVSFEMEKDPQHFFKRWEVLYSESQIKEFVFRLGHVLADLHLYYEDINAVHNDINPFACNNNGFACEFLDLCTGGNTDDFYIRDLQFPELVLANKRPLPKRKRVVES